MIESLQITAEDEERAVTDFFKIVKSLCDNASSYLYQKGYVAGEEAHRELKQKTRAPGLADAVIKCLIRSKETWKQDEDFEAVLAMLLIQWCKEANTLVTELYEAKGKQAGTTAAILALSYQLCLVDRATGRLNLASINDSSYWGIQPLYGLLGRQEVRRADEESPQGNKKSVPRESVTAPTAPEPVSWIQKKAVKPAVTIDKPKSVKEAPKPAPVVLVKSVPTPPAAIDVRKIRDEPVMPKTHTAMPKAEAVAERKPEGPVKAVARVILSHLGTGAFDDVLEAMQNEPLMETLYNSPGLPIYIVEVDHKKRKVLYSKKRKGEEESVSFLNLRKIVAELETELQ